MKYHNYSAADFMMDDHFLKWVKSPDPETELFWRNWLVAHPEKVAEVQAARQMLEDLSLAGQQKTASHRDYQEVWDRLQKPDQLHKEKGLRHLGPQHRKKFRYWVAAAVTGLILVTGTLLYLSVLSGKSSLETAYSEVKTRELPDGSLVTLGPNSKISYTRNWDDRKERELWLKGEAFFSVKHLKNNQQFVVYTNDVEVEVLGTDFNVNDRGGEVKVVLENGQVNLRIPHEDETTEILMQPGEIVRYSPSTRKTVQKAIKDTKKYTSWKDRILIFKGTPVSEIAGIIKDYHGLNVIIKDSGIGDRAFTAEVPVEDPEFLLTLLAESLNLRVTEAGETVMGKTIIIENE